MDHLLSSQEREAVDNYINYILANATDLLSHYINRPIPDDMVLRSRGQLEKPLVKAAIHHKLTQLANEQDLSPTKILKEHINIATSNMGNYLKFGDNGFFVIDLQQCTKDQLAAVKKVKVEHGLFGVQVSIELHDKKASLDSLGKLMDMEQAVASYVAAPKDIKPLAITATPQEAEKAYIDLLESIKC